MDTDYLTEEAYDALIRGSGRISDILQAEIGAMSMKYDGEAEYIEGVKKFLQWIIRNTDEYLDNWNLMDEITPREFRKEVRSLIDKISEMEKIPFEKRTKSGR